MITNKNIRRVIALWCSPIEEEHNRILRKYGDIIDWDTSNVTDMSNAFKNVTINELRLYWDTSNVTNMSNMFANSTFDGDIHDWDTSNVTDMSQMFYRARYFNQDISGWNMKNVKSITNMFYGAARFNGDITNIIEKNLCSYSSFLNFSGLTSIVRDRGYDDMDIGLHNLFKFRRRKNFLMFLVGYGFIMFDGKYLQDNNHILFNIEDMNYYIMKFL